MSLVETPAPGGYARGSDLLRRANLEFSNNIGVDFNDPSTSKTILRSDVEDEDDEASTGSSSIGQPDDDDDDDDNDNDDEDEVRSTISLCSLEDSLPNKRGLSKFYAGKAKSFANLSEVRNVDELGKSENPFNKRRRTLMAYNLMFKQENDDKKKKLLKNKSFYSHSNYISMPLLPLAEITDDDDDDDVDDSSAL